MVKPVESASAAQMSNFGYTNSNGNNNTTLGIFKKIEGTDTDTLSPVQQQSTYGPSGLKEKYKSFIRQLPSKQYIEQLIVTFFREINYQYSALDESTFRDLLRDWHNLSFSTLNKGPSELPPDLQFFPAMLFQALALALQFQPPNYDPGLDSLKYAAAMSFDDLASDYSESGIQILSLLGKRHTTLVTVQAGFLRTSYLKNCGLIPESWHSLSQTIRDAQEIGLHKSNTDYARRRQDDSPQDILENLWAEQLRRRMWMVLSLWDIHMAITLGRPTTIDSRDGKPAFPIDAPIPRNRREVAPSPRTDSDPPTPLTMLLWTVEVSAPLWDIINLEKEDPHQNNFQKVEKMHEMIKQISFHCPPFFRSHNPDLSFDSNPSCYWLPRARATFQNGTAFTFMALHRPYIFTSSSSRTSALKAGLEILRAQRTLFNHLSAVHFKMFSLVLNTFDAIVLVAAIYILHPRENSEDLDDALQHFEWGMERFETMGSRNSMAKSALEVLQAIYMRLKKVLAQPKSLKIESSMGIPTPESSTTTPQSQGHHPSMSSISTTSTTPTSTSATVNSASTPSGYTLPTISNLTEGPNTSSVSLTTATVAPSSGWDTYTHIPQIGLQAMGIDIPSLAPLQPMHDLLFNDLGTYNAGSGAAAGVTGDIDPALWNNNLVGQQKWQFEGDFANDSFWGFMNSYQP